MLSPSTPNPLEQGIQQLQGTSMKSYKVTLNRSTTLGHSCMESNIGTNFDTTQLQVTAVKKETPSDVELWLI